MDREERYGFYDRDGNVYPGNDPFMDALTEALGRIGEGENGAALVDYLATHENSVEIKPTTSGNGSLPSYPFIILFDPESTNGGPCETYSLPSRYTTSRPPFVGLAHEMAHIQDNWRGTMNESIWYGANGDIIRSYEKYAMHIENLIRAEHSLPIRTHYHRINNIPLEISRVVLWNVNLETKFNYVSSPFKIIYP